ncbi:hydroxyacylglutathione hydrolase [Noviherbaspirillum autotrophicum]|uniref:Hydroxyacylglutathione hydrolase n=1 Tax=Noviherbaspirillum autotrophicum TaxID=709839 RepID=A0A0C2BI86_9BURK|nr:hydroxyacylglutathione hydrolase [Noviherbaspirillum autotrophicum]KIF80905.1 hydroxyacylglutathione hydrolase [Noviherbaspirillum autotrophicum]
MLTVLAVPAFQDNYLWLIHDGRHAAVVDPGDATPVLAALNAHQLSLAAILLTHHHADHVGGVPGLLANFHVPVFGPRHEAIPQITEPLSEGDTVTIPELDLTLAVLDVPGHTKGHIAYVAHQQQWLFCGDTLFAGGCGRLFEGTPEQMAASLTKLSALPDATQVYCAHEYTLANLHFAREVEPDNPALDPRIQAEQAKRDHGLPTIPSTIGLERSTNPFLRFHEPAIAERLIALQHLSSREPIAVFTALRQWKNTYR